MLGLKRKPFFVAAPGDVVALEAEAERILASGPNDSVTLAHEAARLPLDLATMVLFRSLLKGENGRFVEALEARLLLPDTERERPCVLVVPGLNHRRNPQTGADGQLLRRIGKAIGVDVRTISLRERGSVSENGETIRQALSACETPCWVVSMSKGTADMRAALSTFGQWPDVLAGWINLSGIFRGTPVADRFIRPQLRARLMLALAAMAGHAPRSVAELGTASPLWRRPVVPPSAGRLIHVVGFPPPWSIDMRIAHHYQWLADAAGPNDGVIPLSECLTYPGRVYPVWGADHFMRTPDVAKLIYRVFAYILTFTDAPTASSVAELECSSSQRSRWPS